MLAATNSAGKKTKRTALVTYPIPYSSNVIVSIRCQGKSQVADLTSVRN